MTKIAYRDRNNQDINVYRSSGFSIASRKDPLRILCISPVYVPIADSEAFCGAKMVTALINSGADITVLFLDRNDPPSGRRYDNSKLWKSALSVSAGVKEPKKRSRLASTIAAARYHTTVHARWVEAIVDHVHALHKGKPFDIVYSRSLPMTAHIAGYWCARMIGLPWVANINDPWDYHLFPEKRIRVSPLSAAVSKYWLKKTLSAADLVTYPSSRLGDFHAKLSEIKHKKEIIPHIGYRATDGHQNVTFNLVHAGKLGTTEFTRRPTSALISGLAQFFKSHPEARSITRLTLVGPEDKETQSVIKEYGLQPLVRIVGRVSYEESLLHIASASVCMLVEGKMNEGIYLPSKLADYIAARKPVLALSPRIGVIADMLPCKGLVRADGDDEKMIANAIALFYKAFREGSLNQWAPSDTMARQFDAETVGNKFLSTLVALCKKDLSPMFERLNTLTSR